MYRSNRYRELSDAIEVAMGWTAVEDGSLVDQRLVRTYPEAGSSWNRNTSSRTGQWNLGDTYAQ